MSKEWVIISLNKKSVPFSDKGDSGAVVVDGLGRIGGMMTGGCRVTDSTDITYATPIEFIMEVVCRFKPLSEAYIKNAQPI